MLKIAKFVSIIGHPLITIPVYILIITFNVLSFRKAAFVSFMIVGCFFVPLIIWNYFKTRKGEYSNFDVSVRKQRYSMYQFAIPLLALVLGIFYFSGQSEALLLNVLFALILLLVSYLVNFYIKCSGHVSLTIYLSFLIVPVNFTAAIILLVFTLAIGWSRIALKRHTLSEVVTGLFLGLLTGFSMLYFLGYYNR